jgi:hypothetical protein
VANLVRNREMITIIITLDDMVITDQLRTNVVKSARNSSSQPMLFRNRAAPLDDVQPGQ